MPDQKYFAERFVTVWVTREAVSTALLTWEGERGKQIAMVSCGRIVEYEIDSSRATDVVNEGDFGGLRKHFNKLNEYGEFSLRFGCCTAEHCESITLSEHISILRKSSSQRLINWRATKLRVVLLR